MPAPPRPAHRQRPVHPRGHVVRGGAPRPQDIPPRPRPPSRSQGGPRNPPPPGWFSRPTKLGNSRPRLWASFLVITVLFGVVLGRVAELQILKGPAYQQISDGQRTRVVDVHPHRGSILDRQGRPLAETVDASAVFADPSMVTDPAVVAEALAPLLGVSDVDLLRKISDREKRFVYLARKAPLDLADQIMALELPGIGTLPESRRLYPQGRAAASVVGFSGVDGEGLAGVEYWYDDLLAGSDGRMLIAAGAQGQRIPGGSTVEQPAVAGSDVVLTLDRDIQFVAQRAIADQVARHKADRGMIVVLNPKTGEVLAMASAPTVDPASPGGSPAEAQGNPAVTHALEPGSVNKVVTAAAALEEGIVTPTSTVVVPPELQIYDKTFTDSHSHGILNLTFAGVVAKSSNIGTIKVAQRLGEDRMYEYLRKFGFGSRTGLGFPGETPGIVPEPKDWSGTSLGAIAIGNGVVVNAVQMAEVLATIANGGIRIAPTLVKETVGPEGERVEPDRPEGERVVSESTADAMTAMLEAVVSPRGPRRRRPCPATESPARRVRRTVSSRAVCSTCPTSRASCRRTTRSLPSP